MTEESHVFHTFGIMYLVKTPSILKLLHPTLLWNKPRGEKVIYLTFDDGPIPDVTNFVLNVLKNHQATATFFCIGDNIVKHPDIFLEIQQQGHRIGNHTFNHLRGWDTEDEAYVDNFTQCQELTRTALFRPPYGRIKRSQVKRILSSHTDEHLPPLITASSNNQQMQIIMWDVLSGDFDTEISGEKCYQNVIESTKNGSIIVFHDSEKAFPRMQYALPKAIKYFKENGYTFGLL